MKAKNMKVKLRIKKDDIVKIITGKEKGKKGKILKIYPKKNSLVIEGANMVKKTQRPSEMNPKGAIMEIERAVNISNVMYFCSKCNKGVRLGKKKDSAGIVKRFCKSCDKIID